MDYNITPSMLGNFIHNNRSGRKMKFSTMEQEEMPDVDEKINERTWIDAFSPTNVLEQNEGEEFEQKIGNWFAERGDKVKIIENDEEYDEDEWNNSMDEAVRKIYEASNKDEPVIIEQCGFIGYINQFKVYGKSDFIACWKEDGKLNIRIMDVKSSWEKKTHYEIQNCCYSILLSRKLEDKDMGIEHEVSAGIINKEDWQDMKNKETISKEILPVYKKEPREDDIYRLLSPNGEIARYMDTDIENIDFSINEDGATPFYEVDIVDSVEDYHLRLAGLTRGEQEAFRKEGIEDLRDLADMVQNPGFGEEDPVPRGLSEKEKPMKVKDEYRDIERKLKEKHGINKNLVHISQKAKAILSAIDDSGYYPTGDSNKYDEVFWLQNSGESTLPSSLDTDCKPFVQVFLDVQKDNITDKIDVISAKVTSKEVDDKITFSSSVNAIYDNNERMLDEEERVLNDFISKLYEEIENVSTTPYLHFYVYEESNKRILMDRLVEQHGRGASEKISSFYNLLSCREGADQKMISSIQKDIRKRVATKNVVDGLITMTEELNLSTDYLYGHDLEEVKEVRDNNFEYEIDGNVIKPYAHFRKKLFEKDYYIVEEENGIRMLSFEDLNNSNYTEKEATSYTVLNRNGSKIPIEYVWGTEEIDRLDEYWEESSKRMSQKDFEFVGKEDRRITMKDIEKLSQRFTDAMHYLERCLGEKGNSIHKEELSSNSINREDLLEYRISPSLEKAFSDYIDMEHAARVREKTEFENKSVIDRVLEGKAIPAVVDEVNFDNGSVNAKCSTAYNMLGLSNVEVAKRSCRIDTIDIDSDSRNWLIAKKLEKYDGRLIEKDVSSYGAPPLATVKEFRPLNGHLEFYSISRLRKGTDYKEFRRIYQEEPEEGEPHESLQEGDILLLEENPDDTNSEKVITALENIAGNDMFMSINDLRDEEEDVLSTDEFYEEEVEEFYKWVKENYMNMNDKQKEFLHRVNDTFCTLQGPPGTGKTSTISPSILSRIYSKSVNGESASALVSGASNKSVNEVMKKVYDLLKDYDGNELNNTLLVRVGSGNVSGQIDDDDMKDDDQVKFLSTYNDRSEIDDIINRLKKETLNEIPTSVIFFATPYSTYKIPKQEPEDAYSMGIELFDLICIDEASMMPLAVSSLVGAFAHRNTQYMICGDHRQMPPVNRHDWKEEKRINILENIPFLSVLDYMRFLRGDEISKLSDNKVVNSPEVDLDITRLNVTYRCHREVADLLSEWIYSKDNIDYTSTISGTLNGTKGNLREGIVEPNRPITLILHDDYTNQQMSKTEAIMSSGIIDDLLEENVGVVSPHNSQVALVSSMCDSNVDIDTVERYQGGERKVMLVSSTVSDYDFLKKEEDFILNPNRLNVALSRMKNKLIVLAPKNIFNMIPDDPDDYDRSLIWKGLLNKTNDTPLEVTIDVFDDYEEDETINLEIYSC